MLGTPPPPRSGLRISLLEGNELEEGLELGESLSPSKAAGLRAHSPSESDMLTGWVKTGNAGNGRFAGLQEGFAKEQLGDSEIRMKKSEQLEERGFWKSIRIFGIQFKFERVLGN